MVAPLIYDGDLFILSLFWQPRSVVTSKQSPGHNFAGVRTHK